MIMKGCPCYDTEKSFMIMKASDFSVTMGP
jgi:hypothetical protein